MTSAGLNGQPDRSDSGPLLHLSSLPCGRAVDDLLEQVAAGRGVNLDDHQAICPHCQAALGELQQLWAPIIDFANQPVAAPRDLTSRVMDRVQALVRDVWYTLRVTDAGAIRVAARIVGRMARDAARTVPGVRAALGRSTHGKMVRTVERATQEHLHPHAAVGVLGQTAAVDLAIAVQYGDPVDVIAKEVQRSVRQRLHETIGMQAVTVNVTVDDVITHDNGT